MPTPGKVLKHSCGRPLSHQRAKRLYALFQFATSTERRNSTSMPALAFGSVARKTEFSLNLVRPHFQALPTCLSLVFLYYMKSAVHFTVFYSIVTCMLNWIFIVIRSLIMELNKEHVGRMTIRPTCSLRYYRYRTQIAAYGYLCSDQPPESKRTVDLDPPPISCSGYNSHFSGSLNVANHTEVGPRRCV